jgi:hypothetical protein
MGDTILAQRVDDLDVLMASLLRTVDRVDRQVERTSREMAAFKDEMAAFKHEMAVFKDENAAFRDEMAAFKDEVRADIEEGRGVRADMNRKWGELANKLGSMAEDLVAPSVPRALCTVLGVTEEPEGMAIRVRRRSAADPKVRREFDVVAMCGDYLLINETKSRLDADDVAEFAAVLPTVRDYFPEHAAKRVIGAIASLHVDESVVRRGEAAGLIVLGLGDDLMDVLNSPGFVPRSF